MRGRSALLTVVLAALGPAAGARAASLVYVKAGNVFISDVDGAHPHQVTSDGSPPTAASNDAKAYRTPSMADDGTIITARGPEFFRLAENGTVLAQWQSTTHAYPLSAAVSPDGTRVAFNYATIARGCTTFNGCYYDPSPGAGIENADGSGSYVDTANNDQDPTWSGNAALVMQSDTSYVREWHPASETKSANWFAPADRFPYPGGSFPYAEEPTVSPSGNLFAVVMRPTSSGGSPSNADFLEIWKTNGPPAAGADEPTPLCGFQTADGSGFNRPSFAPDDSSLIWTDSAGVEALALDATFRASCQNGAALTLSGGPPLIAGATDARFSAAANNPGPKGTGNTGGTSGGSGGPGSSGSGSGSSGSSGSAGGNPTPSAGNPSVRLMAGLVKPPRGATRKATLQRGVTVTVRCSAACTFGAALGAAPAVARSLGLTKRKNTSVVLAVRKGQARGGVARVVTIRLSAAAGRAIRRLPVRRHLSLILELQARGADGRTVVQDVAFTLTT